MSIYRIGLRAQNDHFLWTNSKNFMPLKEAEIKKYFFETKSKEEAEKEFQLARKWVSDNLQKDTSWFLQMLDMDNN
jgi:hypothetical protein